MLKSLPIPSTIGNTLIVMILTKNASFRSYGTFAYVLRAHGDELSGRVRAHTYNYMPGRALQISF